MKLPVMEKTLLKNFLNYFFYGLLVLSCTGGGKPVAGEQIRQVRAVAVEQRELPNEINGFGSLSFQAKIDIAAPQEASIKKIFFREGDSVPRGALVILLENPQIELAVGRAENALSQALAARNLSRSRLLEGMFQAEAQLLSLEKAEAELIQARRVWDEENRKHQDREALFGAGGISEEAIREARFSLASAWEQIGLMERDIEIRRVGSRAQDLAAAGLPVPQDDESRFRAILTLLTATLQAELEAAEARLQAAEKELESVRIARSELRIQSPAAGILGARYFEEGERVRQEDKLLTLMDTSSLYAIFPAPEKEALLLEKGMAARVLLDGTGETREGTLDLVYPQADSQSLSFLVRVLLRNDGGGPENLKPGMFARISVVLGPPRPVLAVPESVLVNKKGREGKVLIVAGNTLSERAVNLGRSLGKDREILSGLRAGEVVVLKPEGDLREGVYVSLVD
ncbi:MAG: efflux RND transporter periplasmic adaptor subunit [Treponema sp.]|jgi:multidrug efflux pump subunit AcrA (membrane-fusion protein)|nr:efflux RND transporter periplasmic adaptor subunit [Treponema sp.]